jgi:hypothetical protein
VLIEADAHTSAPRASRRRAEQLGQIDRALQAILHAGGRRRADSAWANSNDPPKAVIEISARCSPEWLLSEALRL